MGVREAYEHYLQRLQRDRAEATVTTKQYNLIHFVRWCEDEGIEAPAELGGWDFERFQDFRGHLAPTTLENEIGDVKRFVEFCEDVDLAPEGLHEKVSVPYAQAHEQSRDEKLDVEDAAALLAHFRDRSNGHFGTKWHAWLEVDWHTGARLGGIRALDLEHYDADELVLEFRHQPRTDTPLKNKFSGERDVGILPEVGEALDAYIDEHRIDGSDQYGRAPLFTCRSEDRRPAPTTFRSWCYQATQPCWYDDDPCPHQRVRADCEYTSQQHSSQCPSSTFPHAVRTGSISFHQDRGFPIEATAERVDDDIETIQKHYDKSSKRDAFERRRRKEVRKLEFDPEEYLSDSDD